MNRTFDVLRKGGGISKQNGNKVDFMNRKNRNKHVNNCISSLLNATTSSTFLIDVSTLDPGLPFWLANG